MLVLAVCEQLIRYFTCGPQEVRAWTIREGTKAPQAAGVIQCVLSPICLPFLTFVTDAVFAAVTLRSTSVRRSLRVSAFELAADTFFFALLLLLLQFAEISCRTQISRSTAAKPLSRLYVFFYHPPHFRPSSSAFC
jgi:hypothetical protein